MIRTVSQAQSQVDEEAAKKWLSNRCTADRNSKQDFQSSRHREIINTLEVHSYERAGRSYRKSFGR